MAVFAFTDGYVALGSGSLTERSSWIKAVTLTVEVDELEVTEFTDGAWRNHIGGMKSGSLALTFNQDFAASQVDATLWPWLGTSILFDVRPDRNAAVSATNPKFTGSVLVTNLAPIQGSVGDLAELSVTWPVTGAVTRATS